MATTDQASRERSAAEQVARRIVEISSLPQVALRVMQVANDPGSGAADLKNVMEADPALSARVLRCVNSSAYGLRSKITNLQQAIAYLGLKQIRNLAVTASVSDLFRRGEVIEQYKRSELWRHLVAVGIAARMIAMRLRFSNFEDMFLAGLLHDVGIVLIDQHDHERFTQVLAQATDGKQLCEVEKEVLGYTHTELGEVIGRQWSFPEPIIVAARYHHHPKAYRGEHVDLLRCVVVANLICTLKGISSVGRNLLRIRPEAIVGLNLQKEDLQILAEDLDQELATNSGLFHI